MKILLTDSAIRKMTPGTVAWDERIPGLVLRVGKKARTFRFEVERRSGK